MHNKYRQGQGHGTDSQGHHTVKGQGHSTGGQSHSYENGTECRTIEGQGHIVTPLRVKVTLKLAHFILQAPQKLQRVERKDSEMLSHSNSPLQNNGHGTFTAGNIFEGKLMIEM